MIAYFVADNGNLHGLLIQSHKAYALLRLVLLLICLNKDLKFCINNLRFKTFLVESVPPEFHKYFSVIYKIVPPLQMLETDDLRNIYFFEE